MSSHPAEEISSQSAIPNSTGASVADNTSSSNTTLAHFPSTRGGRGQWRGRKRAKGKAGRPEEGIGVKEKSQLAKSKPPPRPRPTHFLSLPLYDHADLRNRVSSFQNALLGDIASEPSTRIAPNPNPPPPSTKKGKGKPPLRISTLVEGLDTSIVIDPQRLHMTLGVMALEPDESPTSISASESTVVEESTPMNPLQLTECNQEMEVTCDPSNGESISKENIPESLEESTIVDSTSSSTSAKTPSPPRKTITSALALLTSLKPSISDILSGSNGVEIPLEILHVFNTERIRRPKNAKSGAIAGHPIDSHVEDPNTALPQKVTLGNEGADVNVGAGVLFLGPREGQPQNDERRKLERVCDLIFQTFKKEGYLTDTRPLKLHCTILNTSHRKPKRRIPFSYSDILALSACQLLGADPLPMPCTSDSQLQGERSAENPTDGDRIPEPCVPEVNAPTTEEKPKYRPPLKVPPPLPVALGTYHVQEVQLWEMGSHGPNNEYVSCGGIVLE